MQNIKQIINRYYHIMGMYLSISEQIDGCSEEDKEFYQNICLLYAKKIKDIQVELADQGIVLH